MLFNIGLLLLTLWVVGFAVFHIAGWFIHIFLVVAVIVILVQAIRGK